MALNIRLSLFTLLLCAGFATTHAAAKNKAFTGEVGDALCGIEHSMPGSAVDCVRECRGKGSNFSLIIGDKVYTLQTEDAAILDTLEKQAGERVKVTGVEKGNIIVVSSVKPLKP